MMAASMIEQLRLVSDINRPSAPKRGRGEARDELLTDDLRSLPWKNEEDPYSARPAAFPSQLDPATVSTGQHGDRSNRWKAGLISPPSKVEFSGPHPPYMVPHDSEAALGPQHPAQQAPNGDQQYVPQKSKRAAKSARRKARLAAQHDELLHLRALVYGRTGSASAMASPLLISPTELVITNKTKGKNQKRKGQRPWAQGQQGWAAGNNKRSGPNKGSATGANTTVLAGSRVHSLIAPVAKTEKRPDNNLREETIEATAIKEERNSPMSKPEYREIKFQSAPSHEIAAPPLPTGSRIPHTQEVEGLVAGAYNVSPIRDPRDSMSLPPYDRSSTKEGIVRRHSYELYELQALSQPVYQGGFSTVPYENVFNSPYYARYAHSPYDQTIWRAEYEHHNGYPSYVPLAGDYAYSVAGLAPDVPSHPGDGNRQEYIVPDRDRSEPVYCSYSLEMAS